jgi:ribonuclease H / adenosylcobalamin/alpha-ribazole phosphatase
MDGESCYTRKLASTTWVVYSPDDDLVSLGGFCLGLATNNVVEYHYVIGLLTEASSLGISHMVVHLDSQLVVSQLNRVYTVHNPILL